MLKLIELFAGIGTQYKAFSKYIETEVVGISEIDEKPLKIYKHLFGEVNNFGDITKITELPAADVWTYSFPCTDLSIAGKQEGFSGNGIVCFLGFYRMYCCTVKESRCEPFV